MVTSQLLARLWRVLALVAVLAPCFASLWLIHRFGRDVPYWDEWDAFVPLIHAAKQGTLRPLDLLAPHNEHRITFSRLITIANAYVTGWNRKAEMYANLLLFMAATLVGYLICRSTSGRARSLAWFIPVAWLMLGWHQWENFLMGAQTQFGLVSLMGLLTFYCLHRLGQSRLALPAAIVAACIGTLSFGSGLLIWPIGLGQVMLQLSGRRHTGTRLRQAVIWGVSAVLVFCYWFLTLIPVPKPFPHGFLYTLQHPFDSLRFLLTCMAVPVAPTLASAVASGLILLVFTLFVLIRVVQFRDKVLTTLAPQLSMILWSLSSAFLITVGRIGMGTEQAFASRYGSVTVVGIVGLYGVLVYVLQDFDPAAKTAAGVLLGVVAAGVMATQITAYNAVAPDAQSRTLGEFAVRMHQYASEESLKTVNPIPDTVRKWAPVLKQYRYSLFRRPPSTPSRDLGPCEGGHIDSVNGRVGQIVTIHPATEPGLLFSGWAVDWPRGSAATAVYLSFDELLDIPVALGTPREDVARAFNNRNYSRSGFSAYLPSSMLRPGTYRLSLKIVGANGAGYCRSIGAAGMKAIEIK